MSFPIDNDVLRAATTQAVLAQLGPDGGRQLLSQVIDRMLAPGEKKGDRSLFELSLDYVLVNLVRDELKTLITNDGPIMAKMRTSISETVSQMLDKEGLAERMASAYVESLRRGY